MSGWQQRDESHALNACVLCEGGLWCSPQSSGFCVVCKCELVVWPYSARFQPLKDPKGADERKLCFKLLCVRVQSHCCAGKPSTTSISAPRQHNTTVAAPLALEMDAQTSPGPPRTSPPFLPHPYTRKLSAPALLAQSACTMNITGRNS